MHGWKGLKVALTQVWTRGTFKRHKRARVCTKTSVHVGQHKKLFYGVLKELTFNLAPSHWLGQEELEISFSFLYNLKASQAPHLVTILPRRFWNLEQCLFSRKVKMFSHVWFPIAGVTLWAIWVERNDMVFNNTR